MTIENNVTYTLWNVFGVGNVRPVVDDADVDALVALIGALEQEGLRVRGLYDVSGLRANADVMLWLHGQDPAALQRAARSFRRLRLLRGLTPVWNAMGVHRAAEFNRSHIPAFMRGATPAKWLTLYPFNRSYEWYLLPEEERREMLAEHGRAGGAYQTVLTNTVSAFALGDYEWLLPVEADDPVELVDMMRALRATKARRHVRDETPFFTGRRIEPIELVELVGS